MKMVADDPMRFITEGGWKFLEPESDVGVVWCGVVWCGVVWRGWVWLWRSVLW